MTSTGIANASSPEAIKKVSITDKDTKADELLDDNKQTKKSYKVEAVAFFIWFWNQFTGIQAVNSYSHETFVEITTDKMATLLTIGLTLLGLIANLITIFYIKKVSKKKLLVTGGLVTSVVLYQIALFGYLDFVVGTVMVQVAFRVTYV